MANFGAGRRSRSFSRDRGDSDRGSRFGGRPRSGGFGDRGSRRPEMHEATCSKCGKRCQVPFRPTGNKPVFCSACFEQSGSNQDRNSRPRDFNSRGSDRPSYQSGNSSNPEQLNQINAKLDKIIKILQDLEMYEDEEDEENESSEENSKE